MAQNDRFGRRMPLPATVQILHDLLIMCAEDDAKQRLAQDKELATGAAKIGVMQPEQVPA
ncbi:hypothetical protein [Methylovirgula sp. HY1]|uniref:hypothetical protein n=1 Tax=Methylovirgula sp. HY1 TaxID=2822761 RepID=UPI001C5B90A1|nr:hypothetical protein [Methylovirgula sp. HY1]QXX76410.1 hypothetical protein MHY1_03250 [Methylovirgula sp. HY1]